MRVITLRWFRIVVLGFVITLGFFFFQTPHVHDQPQQIGLIGPDKPVMVDGVGNFEPPDEPTGGGPGEGGRSHSVAEDRQKIARESELEYGMNMVVSDEISLNRSIPDLRLEECKHWDYPVNLPKASVVVVFHNEGFSTLMRTVTSVVSRSPPQFLEEVLLVDDFSDKTHLHEKLEKHIEQWNGKVRLIRNNEREGLINTRSIGAREARGEIIIFLDAHCEVNKNWLPPLLTPIYQDRTTVTVPIVDAIDYHTFEVRSAYAESEHFRGIFEWGMLYKEISLPEREARTRSRHSEPYRSPTHAGGLFAIDREYFLELGAYDPGLLLWGGENFELSFKVWQCGGTLLWVPCSRVAHVYRGHPSYGMGTLADKRKGPVVTINYKRVVETWMDDKHKEYFYTREPIARFLNVGDIGPQLKLKKDLRCKSFQWFMDEIAYDVTSHFPEPPPNVFAGTVKNVATGLCLQSTGYPPSPISLYQCTNQITRLNAQGQLAVGEWCIDTDSNQVKLVYCQLGNVGGPWHFDASANLMYHERHNKCLAVAPTSHLLGLALCNPSIDYQQWAFNEIQPYW